MVDHMSTFTLWILYRFYLMLLRVKNVMVDV